MLCATTRRAPAERAAAIRVAETSARRRQVRSKPRLMASGLVDCGQVRQLVDDDLGPAACTAAPQRSGSKASPTAGTTSGSPRAATRASLREKTVTS